jgi:5-methylcytosine-specific restriction endonuclease McrA
MQKCNRCKVEKPVSEFHRNRKRENGRCPECKVCANTRATKRYEREGEKLRKQMADQRKRDYEYRLEIERRSRAKNKEKHRPGKNARQSIRNRKLSNNPFEIINKDLKRVYRSECWRCGTKENLSMDHIVPITRGGNHAVGNIMTLCRSCNSSKGNKFLAEWRYRELIGAG